MSKKKRFGISAALTRGLSETIGVVEHHSGLFRNIVLPLSRIELDPDNPRKLAVDLSDIRHGLRPDDPALNQKEVELEKLKELAFTIKANGVINPVVAYKLGEYYRIVAGERRCLAAILAGKQEIEARIFNDKPTGFNLKLIQWVENTAREDLSLFERLENIKEMIQAYQKENQTSTMTATTLKEITGLSIPQVSYYLAVVNAPADVQEPIQKGEIKNLDKAAYLAGIDDVPLRQRLIQACIAGANLKELKRLAQQQAIIHRNQYAIKEKQQGRAANQINMGKTAKAMVVRIIIDAVVHHHFRQPIEIFRTVNWTDFKQVTQAFQRLLRMLESENSI